MVTEWAAESLVFRAVADATRRAIVDLLQEGDLAVQEIAGRFLVSRPAISRHLRILREAGLVSETRKGRQRIYRLEATVLKPALVWLEDRVPISKRKSPPRQTPTQRTQRSQNAPEVSPAQSESNWKTW